MAMEFALTTIVVDEYDRAIDYYTRMKAAGVVFIDLPRTEDYGKVIVFVDLYGNKWDFIGSN